MQISENRRKICSLRILTYKCDDWNDFKGFPTKNKKNLRVATYEIYVKIRFFQDRHQFFDHRKGSSASYLKMRTDFAVHGSLLPIFKIRTDFAVHGSLHLNLKIRTDFAVHGSLLPISKIRTNFAVHEFLNSNSLTPSEIPRIKTQCLYF